MYSELDGYTFVPYTTKDGDTLAKIARLAYGDSTAFDPIVQSNRGVPLSAVMKGGVTLRVPVKKKTQQQSTISNLPPWKQLPSTNVQQAVLGTAALINPTSGNQGSFDGSFD